MGAQVSTEAEDPGVTVVSHGAAHGTSRNADALLHQLSQLKHVRGCSAVLKGVI